MSRRGNRWKYGITYDGAGARDAHAQQGRGWQGMGELADRGESQRPCMEYKQMTIFDYQPPCINFPQLIADELEKHCKEWGYDFIELLKENDGKHFYNIFCSITKTYFVHRSSEEYYDVEFSKDGKAVIRRCGKDFSERGPDAVIDTQSIVDILIQE